MAKQTQPKVFELIEVLIQQLSQFEKVIIERNKILDKSISKLSLKENYSGIMRPVFSMHNKQVVFRK